MIKKWILLILSVLTILSVVTFGMEAALPDIKDVVTIDTTINDELYSNDSSINVVDFSKVEDINYHMNKLCNKLGINYSDLFSLIAFETGGTFDTKVTNPFSGARGLLQFTNSTATHIKNRKGKKFNKVNDLINEYPTAKEQLELPNINNQYGGPVYQYFTKFGILNTRRKLFLAVFYPAAMNWPDSRKLPNEVVKGNPGLNTVGDYMRTVERRIVLNPKNVID